MDWLLLGLLLFVVLNGVDLVLTNAVLRCGGTEFNPVMRWVYSKAGLYGMAILKGLILALFSLQYSAKSLDMYTIWYLDFMFAVLLTLMYFDLKRAGAKIFGVGIARRRELSSSENG